MTTTWPAFHFKVGDHVTGANCFGVPFTGVVTKVPSPWSVVLDGTHWTPVGLITGFDRPATNPPGAAPGAQLSLF